MRLLLTRTGYPSAAIAEIVAFVLRGKYVTEPIAYHRSVML